MILKNFRGQMAAIFALLLMSSVFAIKAQNSDYTAVYRLLNPQNQRHLFTPDCREKNNLARSGSFSYEGVAFYVATRQKRRTVPLYRLLLSNGGHFYTTDEQEMQNLTRDPANRYESVVGYVANSPQRDTVPLYRLMANDRHFYTTSEQEKNNYLRNPESRLEGIPGYVWTSGLNPCDGNQPPSAGNFPVIYAQANFQGPAQAVERDFAGSRDWEGSPHQIRSIRVPRGWYLVLYDKRDFRGRSYNLDSDWTPQPGDYWYGRIRSIKVYQGRSPIQPR